MRHLGGGRPPQRKIKKKKKEKKKEKRKKRKKREKREKRKKGTMNSVKLLHIKCCFFQFFNSPVALKNKKILAPQEKVEMTPLKLSDNENILYYGTKSLKLIIFMNSWLLCVGTEKHTAI